MSTFKNTVKIINGDTVVGFMNSKKIKDLGWMDMASLASWYEDDPNKNHLGLINLVGNISDTRMPTYKEFFDRNAIIEVNGQNGRFTYDIPVVKPNGTFTTDDTSDYSDTPGIDGSVFPIVLDSIFQPGDILTYDAKYGEQVIVSEDHSVERVGDSWKHWVKYVTMDSFKFFPADKLKAGIQYFKIDHALGEYSEQFSNIQSPSNVGTITNEFVLGGHRGVETFYTMYADKKTYNGASVTTQKYWDKFQNELATMGTDKDGNPLDTFMVAKLNAEGKINTKTVRIGATLEYLVLRELMRLESNSLLFTKGAIINDINGTKRINEGIWHQFRRGTRIEYAKPGGITRNIIRQAVAYVFRNRRDLKPHERVIKFRAGYMAFLNVMDLFREEVLAQVSGLAPFLGTDRLLPSSPVKGKSLTSLELEPVMFQKVNIPEIGIVEIVYDPSLDYDELSDRHSAGFYGDGYGRSSYSLVIWDITDKAYSNAYVGMPNGAKLVDGGDMSANVYYVKPQGENFYWGFTNGKYAPDNARGIVSGMKKMGREFWAHVTSAGWVKDIGKSIVIELAQ